MSRGQWTVTQAIHEERQGSAAEAGDSGHSKTQQLSSGPQYLYLKCPSSSYQIASVMGLPAGSDLHLIVGSLASSCIYLE